MLALYPFKPRQLLFGVVAGRAVGKIVFAFVLRPLFAHRAKLFWLNLRNIGDWDGLDGFRIREEKRAPGSALSQQQLLHSALKSRFGA
jgi:hypothetical protein